MLRCIDHVRTSRLGIHRSPLSCLVGIQLLVFISHSLHSYIVLASRTRWAHAKDHVSSFKGQVTTKMFSLFFSSIIYLVLHMLQLWYDSYR